MLRSRLAHAMNTLLQILFTMRRSKHLCLLFRYNKPNVVAPRLLRQISV